MTLKTNIMSLVPCRPEQLGECPDSNVFYGKNSYNPNCRVLIPKADYCLECPFYLTAQQLKEELEDPIIEIKNESKLKRLLEKSDYDEHGWRMLVE